MKKLVLLVCLLAIFTLSACEFDSASLGLPEIELPEIELPGFIEDFIGSDDENNDDTQNDDQQPHEHAYTWTVKQHVKCNVDGIEIGTCECGDTQTRTIEATGHSFVVDEAVEANCTQTGLTEGKHCEKCGHVEVAQEVIPYLHGEAVVDAAVAPTCTETGLTEGSHCSLCDAVLVAQEEVAALGHTEEVVPGVAATCTDDGITDGKKCTVCGVTTVEQEVAPALGHSLENVFSAAATCTEAGNVAHRHCSVCGANFAYDNIVKLSDLANYQWANSGIIYSCTSSGKAYSVANGWRTYIIVDGQGRIVFMIEDPVRGYGDLRADMSGSYARHSAYATENPAITNMSDAAVDSWGNYGYDLVIPQGCYMIAVSDSQVLLTAILGTYTQCAINNTAYNVDDIRLYIDPYDTFHIVNGSELVAVEDVVIPAGHKPVVDDAVAATCTEAGLTEGSHCSVCNEVLVAQQEVKALGHAVTSTRYEEKDGALVKVQECSRCGVVETVMEVTSIPAALEIGGGKAHNAYTTEKYVLAGTVTGLYNTQYGNFYIKDAEGKEICIYGLYSADGKTRYDAMSYKPVDGDYVVVYGVLGKFNTTIQMKSGWLLSYTAHEHNYSEATCTTPATCSICKGITGETLPHTDDDYNHSCDACEAMVGTHEDTTGDSLCEYCGEEVSNDAPAIGTLAEFTFGTNGSAAHVDGNSLGTSKTYTSGSYSLSLTGMSSVYGPATDAKGNSCIKLGTSSKTGSFSFTVAENVTEVIIYVAKYKTNTTKITVNGTSYTISGASNNGVYDEIKIDTTTNKTVNFATATGGVRCMIDAIVFNGYAA